MSDKQVIIIGGGLAGMSAGCYALLNGYRTTIVEHNLALGGVCTAWPRGPYLIDGCIHWLTGGAYQRVYEELEIVPAVQLHTLETWATYTDVRDGFELPFTRDLDDFCGRLKEVAPEDTQEIDRLRQGVRDLLAELPVPLHAREVATFLRSGISSPTRSAGRAHRAVTLACCRLIWSSFKGSTSSLQPRLRATACRWVGNHGACGAA